MSSLIAGRALILVSITGLGTLALANGPRWLVPVLLPIGVLGCVLGTLGAGSRRIPGLEDVISATAELELIVGRPVVPLDTDAPAHELVLTSAQRIRESAARIRAALEAETDRHRTLHTLLDCVDEPILATDAAGRILVCNAPAQELLGLKADRLLGRPVDEAFTVPDFIAVIQAARDGTATRDEVRVPRPDGPRIWETAAVPYGDHGPPKAVVVTLRDVTDRSLALQVKTDFVANASHELRTPVAAIRMAVETLEGLGPADQAMRGKLVTMIAAHTHRLEELIRDLLDLTRLESADARIRIESTPASSLPAALAPMFEGVCRDRRLILRFEFAPQLESLRSDRALLLLILSNLIDNACKFAFEGTHVLVAGRPGDEPRSARFEVVDRGVGIPLGQQQRIFERFFQVDAARTGGPRRGTGLGLSIVKHAVRQLGGSIRVQSVWHHGTTMTVDIPQCLDPAVTESAGTPHQQGR